MLVRRIISVGFIALLILSGLVVLNIVPIMNVSAVGDPTDDGSGDQDTVAGDSIWATHGDWDVTNNSIYSDVTIYVNGNLTVTPGFSLTLYNVTLIMVCSFNGEFTITVDSGPLGSGGMFIYDNDNDPTTTEDGSLITSNNVNYEYGFVVRGTVGSDNFIMKNSELRECGWASNATATEYWAGLQIMTGGAIILNNTITNCYRGVVLYNAEDTLIEGNVFSSLSATGIWGDAGNNGVTIQYNRIYGTSTNYGMLLNFTNNLNILYNTINDLNTVGIYVEYSNVVTIDHNTVTNIDYFANHGNAGIYVEGVTNSTITYNKVHDCEDRGIWVAQLCNNVDVKYNEITNLSWSSITNGAYGFIIALSNDINASHNTLDTGNTGLYIETCTNVTAYQNTIRNCEATAHPSSPSSSGGFGLIIVECILDANIRAVDNTLEYNEISLHMEFTQGVYAAENTIRNSGMYSWYVNEGGVSIMYSTDITLYRNEVYDNYLITQGQADICGYFIFSSGNIIVEGDNIYDNEVNIHMWGGMSNPALPPGAFAEFSNCTISKGIGPLFNNINLTFYDHPSYLTMLNSSFDNNTVAYDGSDSQLIVQYFLNVKTTYGGSPVPGATVSVNDTFGTEEANGTTNAQGWVNWLRCTEYTEQENPDNETYYTPHDIFAEDDTGDKEGYANYYMGKSRWIELPLNGRPEVIDLGPSRNAKREHTFKICANGTDGSEDPESSLTPYFEYRFNNESYPWISDTDPDTFFVGSPSYSNGYWQIDFRPRYHADLGAYDFRVRFKDSYPSYSDWYEVDDMVTVLNNLPYVEDLYEDSGTEIVYRGNTAWVLADGHDVENQDDYNFSKIPAAEFQYKRPGENWGTNIDYWELDPVKNPLYNDWGQRFKPDPSIDTPLGLYGFRVRFEDNDGDLSGWYELDTWLEVKNNIPDALSMDAPVSEVNRGDTIWITANATDVEENENALDVEFSWDAPGGGSSDWETDYLGTPTYVGTSPGGYWKVEFQPPDYETRVGLYKFRVRFTDSDTDYEEIITAGLVEVKNNPPEVQSVEKSDSGVRAGAGAPIYIEVSASDFEDNVDVLKVYAIDDDIQWMFYTTTGTNPSGVWSSSYFGASSYEPSGAYIKVPFQPEGGTSGAKEGYYDIQVRVTDTDSGKSDYMSLANGEKSKMIYVYPPDAEIISVEPEETEVFRTDTINIIVNGDDALDPESSLNVFVEYKAPGEDWESSYIGTLDDDDYDAANDQWEVPFTPDEDAKEGSYQFRGQVSNTDDGFSPWLEASNIVWVRNNLPGTSNLRVDGDAEVERGSSIYVYVDGDDIEDSEEMLSLTLQYSADGTTWDDEYITDLRPPTGTTPSWRATFSPPANDNFPAGDYDFRAIFTDSDGDGDDTEIGTALVTVTNSIPVISDFQVPGTVYRTKSSFIGANVTDVETDENELTANFEYQGPSGGWVGYGDSGSYFESDAEYINGYWRIEFKPPADAEKGEYSFRVTFNDGDDDSEIETRTGSLTVRNNPPEIDEITQPTEGKQSSSKVTFEATVEDEEDGKQSSSKVTFEATVEDEEDGTSVTYNWDFGDGESSNEANPEHTYGEPGTYKVTLTVTDSDGDESEQFIYIEVPGGGDTAGGMDMMLLLALLIPLIVVILILVLLLTRKKKPGEAPPPVAPAAAPPGAPPAGEVPAAAPAGEVPAAAPAAVPAAAPVGAPPPPAAPAGQKIKCPKCGTGFNVESAERPITIQCPSCGAKGKLT
jgi:parallel beta-helix repeat protein